MNRFLELAPERRRAACEQAGQAIGLDAPSVEKDFWVCWALREVLALPQAGEHLTIKGGTSLSKGWKLIERFSEDLDLALDRGILGFGGDAAPDAIGISGKESERRLEKLSAVSREHIQGAVVPALRARLGSIVDSETIGAVEVDPLPTALVVVRLRYPTSFSTGVYVRPEILLEFNARADAEPTERCAIRPYLDEALPGLLGSADFPVRAVSPARTFWEKAMLLHEELFRAADSPKPRLARHYYDLWCLIRSGWAERALADRGLFDRIASHRAVYFRKNAETRQSLQAGTLNLVPSPSQMTGWRGDYDAMRDTMFFGDPPRFEELMRVAREFQERFNATG